MKPRLTRQLVIDVRIQLDELGLDGGLDLARYFGAVHL